jgi:hypothetical protein
MNRLAKRGCVSRYNECIHSRKVSYTNGPTDDLLRAVSIGVLILVIALPVLGGNTFATQNLTGIDAPQKQDSLAVGGPENLLHIGLPGAYRATPGRTLGMNGFAYVNTEDSRVYFTDPISGTTLNMSIGPTVSTPSSIYLGEDIDDDGQDEFIAIKRPTFSSVDLYIVDFNNDTLIEWPFLGVGASVLGTGDFNGDSQMDVAINVNGGDWMIMMDLSNGAILGLANETGIFRDYSAIGRFSNPLADQIVLTNDTYVWVINGDGSPDLGMSHVVPRGIYKIDYDGGLSDFFITDNLGRLTLYQGSDLSIIYQTIVSPVAGQMQSAVGEFTGDSQEDIVVVSTSWHKAQFIDGSNGTIIRETPNVNAFSQALATGQIDSDAITDVILVALPESPCFIHGYNAEIAYVETLIENTDSIHTFDLDGNSRDDIFINSGTDLYILLSELEVPVIVQEPFSPLHPTVEDDFVKVEIHIDETTSVESARLFFREEGTSEWLEPESGMLTPDNGKTFFAFLVGLKAALYEYFFAVQDVYLNVGYLANATHPNSFEITGHLAWENDKSNIYNRMVSKRVLASGNASDGSPRLYSLELAPSGKTIYLNKYLADGSLENNYPLDFTSGTDFSLFSGIVDSDAIIDPIAVVSADGATHVYVLHGLDFTLYHYTLSPIYLKSIRLAEVLDGNGDGRDDLYLLVDTDHFSLARMDSSGSWTSRDLTDPENDDLAPQFMMGAYSRTGKSNNLTIVRGNTLIEVFDGADISHFSIISIPRAGFTKVEAKAMTTMDRSIGQGEEFALGLTFWSGAIPETRIYLYSGMAGTLGDLDTYFLPEKDGSFLFPFDVEQDNTDELLVLDENGELILARVSGPLTIDWTLQVSDSTPLSGIVTDFDGDLEREFVLFTKEDGLLTAVSTTGEVDRTAEVGEVYIPIWIGNVDAGNGQEIAAYPIVQGVGDVVMGAVRDLDWYYRMGVSVDYYSSTLVQGEQFSANVTVMNIYGDIIDDASVYMTAHFMTPEGPAANTFGFYFWEGQGKYSALTDVNWPIGTVNLSIVVDNRFYRFYQDSYVDALVVRSSLRVDLQIPDIVQQGTNTSFRAIVFDNLGGVVERATVTISIDGVVFPTIESGQLYVLDIPEVQLEAGIHVTVGRANHAFALADGVTGKAFTVQVLTENLIIATDFPATIIQDEPLAAWFNITDAYGHPIIGANVALKSGASVYGMMESPTVPGSYRFLQTMILGIGVHSFDLNVEKPSIIGPPARTISFEVYGDLEPNVFYETRVEGGSMFDIHVFVKDKYGPVTAGTSVSIDINGTIYIQIDTAGNPDYILTVLADFLMGKNNFTIYVNATYATQWMGTFSIRAYSDASASASLSSSQGWTILQGDRTRLELTLEDWLGRPVSGASISFFVKALAYNLIEIGPGLYAVNVSTTGWAPGRYEYTVSVKHEDIQTGDPITGNITILGVLEFIVTLNPEEPTQGSSLLISIFVVDAYGNPVPGLEIFAATMNMPAVRAEETEQVGLYVVFIEHLPATEGYGTRNINIEATGQFVQPATKTESFYLDVAAPNIGVMDAQTVFSFTGISFALSLIGMFVYFRMAPSLRRTGTGKEEMQKSVRRMDKLYLAIVLASALSILGAMSFNSIRDYGGALILTVVLLGASVLLYGLWLYRDAVSAVMVRGALSRKRIVAGLWHLFFVPVVIVMILNYGAEIDWFKAYMIDQTFNIAGISIPTIMTTIFTAYVSSILVVVVNLYREVSNGLKKLKKMQDASTPLAIIEDEKETMVSRYSSSIRIKFLMFLVVVGAAAVTTMDFLQSYELGVIVLMPVAFLVVIPFISSKIVQGLNRASKVKIKKSIITTEEVSTGLVTESLPKDDSEVEIEATKEMDDNLEDDEDNGNLDRDSTEV